MSAGGRAHGSSISPHSMARPDEVVVDGVRAWPCSDADRDVVLRRVVDAVVAGHAPHPHRGEHLEVGGEGAHADLEAHLVVALAGAAVRDRVGAELTGRDDEVLGDHRARERGHERVLALVERVGPRARGRSSRRRTRPAASTTLASTAPAANARWRIASKSPPWPTSTASAITSAPHSSPIHFTATEVSSPPEYASTTRFAIARRFLPLPLGYFVTTRQLSLQAREGGEVGGDLGAADLLGADQDDRVVARHRAEHVGDARRGRAPTPPRARSRGACAARRGSRCATPPPRTPPSPGAGGRRARCAPWRARGSRRPSSRRGSAPSPRPAPPGRG